MCCAVTIMLIFGPRAAAIVWSLLDPTRWLVFDNLIVPILGLIFLPWTLLAYVWLSPDGVGGIEWVIVVIAFLVDIGSLSGGAYSNRRRIRQYRSRA
jgi:hypothetical protein